MAQQHLPEEAPEFEFTDSRDSLPGDNYYVRVIQLNDGVAWGSPVWVGGFGKR